MLKGVNNGEIESSSETSGNKNLPEYQSTRHTTVYQNVQEPSTEPDYLPEYQTHQSVPDTSQEPTTNNQTNNPSATCNPGRKCDKRAKATNKDSDYQVTGAF